MPYFGLSGLAMKDDMKNNDEFAQMQRDHIKLNKTRRKQLGKHMTALHSYLSDKLPGFLGTERHRVPTPCAPSSARRPMTPKPTPIFW